MPVLFKNGRAAMGIDGNLSVDGLYLTSGVNGRAWLNDAEVLTQNLGRLALVAVNVDRAIVKIRAAQANSQPFPDITDCIRTVDAQGANEFYAGANVWAAWLAEDPSNPNGIYGYRDSHGKIDTSWHPIAVDDATGTIALYIDGPSRADVAFWNGTKLTPIWGGPLRYGAVSFRNGIFAAPCPDGRVRSWNAVTGEVRTFPAIPPLRDALLCGEFGVGWSDAVNGLVAYRLGETTGLVVTRGDHDFNADALLQGSKIVVVSSYGAGERGGELRRYVIDTASIDRATTNLLAPPPAVVPPVAQASRPIAVGCFDEPNGAEMTGSGWPTTPKTKGVFVDLVHDSPATVREQTQRAVDDGLPIYIYKDNSSFSPSEMPAYGGARQIAMPRNTIEPGESREAAVVRLRGTVQKFAYAGFSVALDIHMARGLRADGTYTWTEQEILDRAADAWQIAVDEGVVAVWCFAWDRADGIATFPSFQQFVSKIRAATPNWQAFPMATPPAPKPEPPKPPTIEVPDMKSRKIYLRSRANNAGKYIGLTKQSEGGLLTVTDAPQAFYALLISGKWDDGQRVFLSLDDGGAVLVQAKGDGAQLNLNDRFGSPLGIVRAGDGWALVATGSPVSVRAGRADYTGDDVGQVRTMDPTYAIGDWETVDVIDANTGNVIGPF